jgi:hypothetical protein
MSGSINEGRSSPSFKKNNDNFIDNGNFLLQSLNRNSLPNESSPFRKYTNE